MKNDDQLAKKENLIINEGKYMPRKYILKISLLECRNLEIISGEAPNPFIEIDVKNKTK
jgi:hypothetical protein